MGKLDGKAAFVTGAARGMGRNHAVRLAREGADIIAVDLCAQIDSVAYPMSTAEDLQETVRLVESAGRQIVARQADVRNKAALQVVVDEGVRALGRLDIVVANAGIAPMGSGAHDDQAFHDVIAVNLVGVWNTAQVALATMVAQGDGGCVLLIGSVSSTTGIGGRGPGGEGYTASKHGVMGLMRNLAVNYAQYSIRVNVIQPAGTRTPMVMNDVLLKWIAEDPSAAGNLDNLLPVDMLEPDDISNAVVWLASDDARYVTGIALPVDAGFMAK